jgi:enoyl-CoA hydratase/carnithine racemase
MCHSFIPEKTVMSMENRISLEIQEGVAHATLVRADKMNALDGRMFNALVEVGESLRDDPAVKVVVLSAEGRAFCAGLDTSNFMQMAGGDKGDVARVPLANRTHGVANLPQHAAWMWRDLPVPVIAAVHGVAFGGGLQVALGADMRYAAPDTRFSVMEIKWGLVPDMAGTPLLRELVRGDRLRELVYTGRIFDAPEALELGIVTRLCDDPLEAALATARDIAGRNPDAIRADKRLLNALADQTAEEALLAESEEQDAIIGKPNQIEAVMAELEKRPAKFS